MRWKKLANWLPTIPGMTHAAMPFYFEGDIYFSPRDNMHRSHIYRAHFNPRNGKLGAAHKYLEPGTRGSFDDCGAMVSWVQRNGPNVFVYYIGWNVPVTVPFRNCLGLAIDRHKLYGPVCDRDLYNPYGVGSCSASMEYYLSVLGWETHDLQQRPRYHIVKAHPHSIAITFKDAAEYAIARPCVLGDEMWYCYRGAQYRIGYATQEDGVWERKDDEAGITVSVTGFDDTAVCYPHVFDHEGQRFMLYNGNSYGRTGFGLAVME